MKAPSKKAAARASKARKELGDLPTQLAEVANLKGQALIDRYTEVVGKAPKSKNQHFLRKRIAIELQSKATGHPTPEEKARIKEVQAYALKNGLWPDIRNGESRAKEAKLVSANEPPLPAAAAPVLQPQPKAGKPERDPRLPAVGTVITKEHANEKHQVKVLEDGFEYRGEKYRSLSKIARVITGTTWNGFLYFGLAERKAK